MDIDLDIQELFINYTGQYNQV